MIRGCFCDSRGPFPVTGLLPNTATDYVGIGRLVDLGGGNASVQSAAYLPLSSFASSTQVEGIAAQLSTLQRQSQEIGALAASFNITPPNPGDRFSLSVGGAGGDGYGAGSISGAYRVTSNALLYAGVARGPTQTMAKGGLSMSFR